MWPSIPEVFPFFKRGRSTSQDGFDSPAQYRRQNSALPKVSRTPPTLRVNMDKMAYRPGDVVVATIDVCNNVDVSNKSPAVDQGRSRADAVLMEDLQVEVKGVERVDPQWLVVPRPPSGGKGRRGERTILELLSTTVVSNILIGAGETRTYLVRTMLPKVLPPSYRGTAVRYVYYMTTSIRWAYSVFENGHGAAAQSSTTPVETRTPLNVWILPDSSGLTADELHSKFHYGFSGIVPPTAINLELQWREKDQNSIWAQATDVQLDDDESSRCSESTQSSPVRGSFEQAFERALVLKSSITPSNSSVRKAFSHSALPEAFLSEKEVIAQDDILSRSFDRRAGSWDGSTEGTGSFQGGAKGINGQISTYEYENDGGYEKGLSPPSSPSMRYVRPKTYNIRINDQILVQFGPRNPELVYYYGDVVSGTLSILRDGARRCLEVSAKLEYREILNPSYIHPSRKNSSVNIKNQSEYFETVCDVLHSHFIFSIPMDGPPSFSTPLASVRWYLRFEFVASAPNVDWSKYAHPLLVEEKQSVEWLLPIKVHPPLPPHTRRSLQEQELLEANRTSFSSSIDGSPLTRGGGASSVSSS